MRLEKEEKSGLPLTQNEDTAFLFYVFNGEIQVNEGMVLTAGESVLIENESPVFIALEKSDIVLFSAQTNAIHSMAECTAAICNKKRI